MAVTYNEFLGLGFHSVGSEASSFRHFLCSFPRRMQEALLVFGPGDEGLVQGQEFGILRGVEIV